MTTTSSDRNRENRLRRLAARQGLKLKKSRRRDPYASDYGGYWIIEPRSKAVATFLRGDQFGLTLDTVEWWLTSDKKERPTSPLVRRGSTT